MKVDDKKYAKFEYNDGHSGDHTKNPFQRGDVVIKAIGTDENLTPEIGVVLQVHDEYELRTDMFGNESIDYVRLATKKEIQKYRPKLLVD
tara:strand:- start:669 stop:938 length:270 start_codon:yes stop_codon:yes gene_type:complete